MDPWRQSLGARQAGGLYALAAYGFWGVAPIYFKWVEFAAPVEILAHRVVWAFIILLLLVTLRQGWRTAARVGTASVGWLGLSGALVLINWIIYIWALQNGRIVEASLGYYINPLVTVLLGLVFLGERLRWPQAAAAALAALGVANEVLTFGALPWAGLLLAFSFGFYGLVRKRVRVDPVVGLGVETGLALPFALALLAWWAAIGEGALATADTEQIALLGLGGVVTVVPLVWFAAAAMRLSLVVLGFYQYLAPTLMLLVGAYYYDQPVVSDQWLTFGCIWAALAFISAESLYYAWRLRHHPR